MFLAIANSISSLIKPYISKITSALAARSDYYENIKGTNNILFDFGVRLLDKASIVLTPTAYSDGSLNTVIPPYQVLPTELVTNGTFDTDSDWLKSSTATISNGSAHIVSDGSYQYIGQVLVLTVGKKYRVEYEIVENNSGSLKMSSSFGSNFNPISSTVGFHSFEAVAIASTLYIERQSTCDIKIDNVSVKEIQEADFDFSRGSSATRVNEQGLVEDVQILSGELVQNGDFEQIGSELVTNGSFDNSSSWGMQSSWSILNGSADYDGISSHYIEQSNVFSANTFYKITFTVSNNTSGIISIRDGVASTLVPNTNYTNGTHTFYIKSNTNTSLRIYGVGGSGTLSIDNVSVKEVGQNWIFNTGWSMRDGKAVSDGSANNNIKQVISFNPSVLKIKFDVSDLTQGSVRLFVNTPTFTQLINAGSNGSYETTVEVTSGANNIFFYSTNNFIGSIDNISVIEITDDTDLPRIDYTDGTGSLLLEPQSTNLVGYSLPNNTNWSKGSNTTITENYAASPDGTQNASRLVMPTGSGTYAYYQFTATSTTDHTLSFYAKNNGGGADVTMAFFAASQTQNITLTNEWQRFEFTTSITSGNVVQVGVDNITSVDMLIFGVQCEALPYATSYIPTSGSTVTRSADLANNSGNADLFNDSEGVLYAEIAALANDGTKRRISINNGAATQFVQLEYRPTTNTIQVGVYNGSSQGFFTETLSDVTTFNKIAYSYKANEFKLFANGSQLSTTITSGSTFSSGTLTTLSFDNGAGADDFYGKTKCVAVFKEALSNDLLERLTGEGYESFRLLAEANNYTII